MFDTRFIRSAINRSAESGVDRRRFLTAAGLSGAGIGAAALIGAPGASAATSGGPSDAAILNFALNLEYLEAEFYSLAVTGAGLPDSLTTGTGTRGRVQGGRQVKFKSPKIRQYAQEIAKDEREHVAFLRTALGGAKVSRPAINLDASFTAAAMAAGVIKAGEKFDPYANEQNFLLAAFIFEDVGVTAYKGAAPLIDNKTYLSAAAGILAAEAYHAGLIRTSLYDMGLEDPAGMISKARNSLDGPADDDQGISVGGTSNIVPTDANGIAFSRTPGRVLNVVYLTPKVATSGGFFPNGVNGALNQSGGGSPVGGTGAGTTPTGGAQTGGGGTADGPNTDLLVGGAVAAAGAVAVAGAYQHNKKGATLTTPGDTDAMA